MASFSSSRPPGNLTSDETDSLPHPQSKQWDIFLSHSGEQKGFVKDLFKILYPPYNVFFDIDRPSLPLGDPFPPHIFHAIKTCKVALVVLSNEFLCSKWPMVELSAFFDTGACKVLPLFYELSPQNLSDMKMLQEWHKRWEEFASKDDRIEVSSWDKARKRLCSINGPVFKKSDGELAYLDEILSAIYQMIPPTFSQFSHEGVYGRDRLCRVFIDRFEKLERMPENQSVDHLSRVYVLGVYGLPGSGKSTLCACLRDHFFSSFAGRALHLKLPTDPTPTQLMETAKKLLKLTNFGHYRERMKSEIEDLSQIYNILKASDLQSSRVFLVIDNISSRNLVEAQAILRLGVGPGSRVMLVARTWRILRPLLNFPGNPHSDIHYVCDSMSVPSINDTEATCLLMQSADGLGSASNYGQKMEEEYSPISHRGILAKVARMCAFRNRWHQDLLYLPLALKTIGPLLRSNEVDLDRQLSKLEARMKDFKEVAVREIVEESYKKLPEKLKLLFLDVALFMVPYGQIDESAAELLGFMHECTPATIKRELNELMGLCFLQSVSEFDVHDVFLEFANSVSDASSMYYCKRRKIAGLQEVLCDLSKMARRPTVVLRAVILEVDEKCERFDFPAGLSSVKVVVVRQCKSLEVLGLAGLTSLVSLEIEDCPRLRHLDLDPGHAYTLTRVRWVGKKWGDCIDVAEQQQRGSFQKSLLQMLQAGSGMPARWLINKVWCSVSALGGWHHRPPINGFMNLASQLKALQALRLEQTGITSLGDLSSCWPQLQVLEVFEGHLDVLELGNLPNLKQFFYGDGSREVLLDSSIRVYASRRTRCDPKMVRNSNLLAGCPELEDVRFCDPSYEDGMGSLILPPNLRFFQLHTIHDGEPVLLEFSSSTCLLEKILVYDHRVLQSVGFTCEFSSLLQISLGRCKNLVTITGLEWIPMLQDLTVRNCDKLQSLGNLGALRMLERLNLERCPVLTISSPALRSQRLATIYVAECPNVQFLASDLENLTALSSLRCTVFGNMFKLKNLVKLDNMRLDWKREEQASNPLSLCSLNDDEANCDRAVNGNVAQVQGMKCMPLLVVGEAAAPLSRFTLCSVQNLVSLDGIYCLRTLWDLRLRDLPELTCLQGLDGIHCTLRQLSLKNLPKLTCLQGLQSLINLTTLTISQCPAVKELPSLCSLVKMRRISITECVNLICLEGLHNMQLLEMAYFDGCENLEHLDWGPDTLEQLWVPYHLNYCFRGCKFASIQAMVGWVLDENVSGAVWCASWDALMWELSNRLLEKPRERMELAEQLVEILLKRHPALMSHGDDCFDFQPWVDELKEAWSIVCVWRKERGEPAVSFPRGLEELMEKLGRVPLKEVVQQCQSDAHFRASAANCIIESHMHVLYKWICRLASRHLGYYISDWSFNYQYVYDE